MNEVSPYKFDRPTDTNRVITWPCSILFAISLMSNPVTNPSLSELSKETKPKYLINITSPALSQSSSILDLSSLDRSWPKTNLVKRLLALREQAISQGMNLLTIDEISRELQVRRGEHD